MGLPQAGTLDGQLGVEAAARLKDAETITLEQLEAALRDGGVGLANTHQVMGRNQLALYCVTADGTDGVIVTICEYSSAEAAVKGEKETSALSSKVAGHTARVRKKSVLHLVRKTTTPDATVEKIYAAFDAL